MEEQCVFASPATTPAFNSSKLRNGGEQIGGLLQQIRADSAPLQLFPYFLVEGEILVARGAESVQHARVFDCLHAVRHVAGEIK